MKGKQKKAVTCVGRRNSASQLLSCRGDCRSGSVCQSGGRRLRRDRLCRRHADCQVGCQRQAYRLGRCRDILD